MSNLIRGISENGGVVFCGVDSTEIVRTAEKLPVQNSISTGADRSSPSIKYARLSFSQNFINGSWR